MAGNSAVFDLRTLSIETAPTICPRDCPSWPERVGSLTYKPLGPEVLNQLFFQHSRASRGISWVGVSWDTRMLSLLG